MYDMKKNKNKRMNSLITSVNNEKVKSWCKLHRRKGRREQQAFLIEGIHLIEEAWKSGAKLIEIIAEESFALPDWSKGYPVEPVSRKVFQKISQTENPQGAAAVVALEDIEEAEGTNFILIDAVQDPGNLGTIIRTADAAGMDAVVLGKGTVDLYNDKVIRATQGSIFHIPVYEADLLEEVNKLKDKGFTIWATALEDAEEFSKLAAHEKTAVILGNEGAGVNEQLLKQADYKVTIPIYGKAESLNVSIAAGILMYHLKR